MDIELIAYDFDGVMTDNMVYVSDINGQNQPVTLLTMLSREFVRCSRLDGWGVNRLRQGGYYQIIVTRETNHSVTNRAHKLGIHAYTGVADKAKFMRQFCSSYKYELQKTAFVGDYLNDLEVMRLVGHPFCPSDAHPRIRHLCTPRSQVLSARGGHGVVAELSTYLLD